jgi:propionyl-CoA carboxylase beta chain
MTDYSQMYITGPAVVKSVTGEAVSAAELGGAAVHGGTSGVAHFTYPDDLSCLNGVRRLLGYLPQNNAEKPLTVPGRAVDGSGALGEIVPVDSKKPYDVRSVIGAIVDENSFLEVQEAFARNIVVGFARLDGETLGIVANQSLCMAGALEINASDKASRFIRFCDSFGIPLLTLVDVPAFLPGSQQEHGGIIRHGAKLLYAYSEATVPKVGLIMRKAYGGAYIAMNSKGTGADLVYAWPIAEIAVMGAAGAVSIIGKKEIEKAEDPAARREELVGEYNEKFMNPYIAAEHGYVDEVILPEETRSKIAGAFKMLRTKAAALPAKKHGNIPL